MTIMDGPVYRYDKDAADQSKRWPEYWDGRWFLHNNGGPSIKHGLLLDPDTAGTGGLPVYADSLRDTLTWNDGSYMDSKFGTDGALYVQTYDGFFRAGPGVSIYRYDYIGGAPTPNAAPRAVPIGDYEVRFSRARLRWRVLEVGLRRRSDVDRGQPDCTRYAEAKRYTAKLTVTYADGSDGHEHDRRRRARGHGRRRRRPRPPRFNPPEPGNGGTYTRPVTVTLTATDAAGGSRRGHDRVPRQRRRVADYSAPIDAARSPGAYRIEFRSTDQTGNVEERQVA